MVHINFFGENKSLLVKKVNPGRPTVIFFHGFPDDKYVWKDIEASIDEGMNLVAIDLNDLNPEDLLESKMFILHLLKDIGLNICNGLYFVGHDIGGPIMSVLSPFFCHDLKGMIFLNSMDLNTYRKNIIGSQLLKSWYAFAFQVPLSRWFLKKDLKSIKGIFKKIVKEHNGEVSFKTIDYYKFYMNRLLKLEIPIASSVPKLLIISKDDRFLKVPYKNMLSEKTEISVIRGGHWDVFNKDNIAVQLLNSKISEWEESTLKEKEFEYAAF